MTNRSFRYSLISDPADREQVRSHAIAIRRLASQTGQTVIEVGRQLIAIHRLLQPTLFRQWARAEFCWTLSTVSNYMRAAERFSNVRHPERWQPSAMFALVRKHVPEAVLSEAVRIADTGGPVTLASAKRLLTEAGVQPLSVAAGRLRKPEKVAAAAAAEQTNPIVVLTRWCADFRQRWSQLVGSLSAADCDWLADQCEQVAARLRPPLAV